MENNVKTIAVLTSGGDAPGMNSAIRAVVRAGLHHKKKVIGVMNGYQGLLEKDFKEMQYRDVSGIMNRGGTVIKTARSKEFETKEGVQKAIDNMREAGIDALVVIGGDGSFRGARDLANSGFPVMGIPGTIDNDIGCSDYTIGFDTALNTAVDAIDKIRDTGASHERCSVVEVMGRHAGYLAVHTAVATGAEIALVPEISFEMKDIINRIREDATKGKSHFIIVVAEGVGGCDFIAKTVQRETGIESRDSYLGYIQRGGRPSQRDRVMASRMGLYAVEKLINGEINQVIIYRNAKVQSIDIGEALSMKKDFNYELHRISDLLAN